MEPDFTDLQRLARSLVGHLTAQLRMEDELAHERQPDPDLVAVAQYHKQGCDENLSAARAFIADLTLAQLLLYAGDLTFAVWNQVCRLVVREFGFVVECDLVEDSFLLVALPGRRFLLVSSHRLRVFNLALKLVDVLYSDEPVCYAARLENGLLLVSTPARLCLYRSGLELVAEKSLAQMVDDEWNSFVTSTSNTITVVCKRQKVVSVYRVDVPSLHCEPLYDMVWTQRGLLTDIFHTSDGTLCFLINADSTLCFLKGHDTTEIQPGYAVVLCDVLKHTVYTTRHVAFCAPDLTLAKIPQTQIQGHCPFMEHQTAVVLQLFQGATACFVQERNQPFGLAAIEPASWT